MAMVGLAKMEIVRTRSGTGEKNTTVKVKVFSLLEKREIPIFRSLSTRVAITC